MKDKTPTKVRGKTPNGPGATQSAHEHDSALASLFASSAGPVSKPPPKSSHNHVSQATSYASPEGEDDSENESIEEENLTAPILSETETGDLVHHSRRKRKLGSQSEEIEDVYLRRLAQDDESSQAHAPDSEKRKRVRLDRPPSTDTVEDQDSKDSEDNDSSSSDKEEDVAADNAGADADEPPLHESLMPSQTESEMEKASRTVFLGNVSNLAISSKSARRKLTSHLSTVLQSPTIADGKHKIQSLRFRSTAYAGKISKRGAFAQKDLMDATTKSTNAYVVYTAQSAAREAAKTLNGTIVLDRHLRADLVAHPAKIDHRRCVFVGNLGFVDDESSMNDAEEDENGDKRAQKKKSKQKEPGDMEEGLWREFGKAGTVESVRVVRDPKTRVGKGFAYVQFTDENAVEAALLYDGKKFPPLLPRKLRVTRAKSFKRNAATNARPHTSALKNGKAKGPAHKKDPRIITQQQSLEGRARKMLGKAGAAAVRNNTSGPGIDDINTASNQLPRSNADFAQIKAPEKFVFEGHRANSRQKPSGLKLSGKKGNSKGKGKRPGKPSTRSAKRAAAWKVNGSK